MTPAVPTRLTGPGPRRDVVGYGRHVPKVTWPDGARVAVSIVLNWEEGSEYSKIAGRRAQRGRSPRSRTRWTRSTATSRPSRSTSTAAAPASGACSGCSTSSRSRSRSSARRSRSSAIPRWPSGCERPATSRARHGWRWEEVWTLSREEEREHMLEADRVDRARPAASGRTAGTAATAPRSTRASCSSRRAGSSTTPTPTTTTCPYYVEVDGKRHLIVPYSFTYNDGRFVLPQGFSRPGVLLRPVPARPRLPAGTRARPTRG